MTEHLGVSIVIASKGRVKLLGDLLESLLIAREKYAGASEVLVIDDSSPSDAEAIAVLCDTFNCRIITFGPSVASKRNFGAGLAQYDIILFLDSDCLATPQILSDHIKLYADPNVGGVAGLLKFVGEDTWFWKAVDKSPYVICFGFPAWLDTVPWAPSANLSVRKTVFNEIGGFDTAFPQKPGGEDVDLGLRITKSGRRIACTKEGLVFHSKSTWIPVKDMVHRLWHYGSADCYLMERHQDYSMGVLPRRLLVYALVLLCLFFSASFTNWWLLMAFPVWLLFDISLVSILMNHFNCQKHASFLQQFVVQLLMLVNEAGYLVSCLRRKHVSYWFKQIVYFDGQLDGIQYNGSISMWSLILGIVLILIAATVIPL